MENRLRSTGESSITSRLAEVESKRGGNKTEQGEKPGACADQRCSDISAELLTVGPSHDFSELAFFTEKVRRQARENSHFFKFNFCVSTEERLKMYLNRNWGFESLRCMMNFIICFLKSD